MLRSDDSDSAQQESARTKISDAIFQVCEVDIRCQITLSRAVEYIHDFVILESLSFPHVHAQLRNFNDTAIKLPAVE